MSPGFASCCEATRRSNEQRRTRDTPGTQTSPVRTVPDPAGRDYLPGGLRPAGGRHPVVEARHGRPGPEPGGTGTAGAAHVRSSGEHPGDGGGAAPAGEAPETSVKATFFRDL